ncbi:hypothetical protein JB92DRAFT_3110349 [Gautieria morchelliformis]|nr:hypothetical protein JB92DRAFT_3110349 [Gautieria morchelliformis]
MSWHPPHNHFGSRLLLYNDLNLPRRHAPRTLIHPRPARGRRPLHRVQVWNLCLSEEHVHTPVDSPRVVPVVPATASSPGALAPSSASGSGSSSHFASASPGPGPGSFPWSRTRLISPWDVRPRPNPLPDIPSLSRPPHPAPLHQRESPVQERHPLPRRTVLTLLPLRAFPIFSVLPFRPIAALALALAVREPAPFPSYHSPLSGSMSAAAAKPPRAAHLGVSIRHGGGSIVAYISAGVAHHSGSSPPDPHIIIPHARPFDAIHSMPYQVGNHAVRALRIIYVMTTASE